MSPPTILLIPGLGADRDLFYPQQQHFKEQLLVLEGPTDESLWRQQPSMSAAAEAFLALIEARISPERPYILGGMSFGGSLAIEIARRIAREDRIRQPETLVLIASNRTSDSISRGFRFNRFVGSGLPHWLIRRSLKAISGLFARREKLSVDDRILLREMADRADLTQLLWGANAIANWSCSDAETDALGIPIRQLHGRGDWVIPMCERHVTTTLEDGQHLVTWTHHEAVSKWLQQIADSREQQP